MRKGIIFLMVLFLTSVVIAQAPVISQGVSIFSDGVMKVIFPTKGGDEPNLTPVDTVCEFSGEQVVKMNLIGLKEPERYGIDCTEDICFTKVFEKGIINKLIKTNRKFCAPEDWNTSIEPRYIGEKTGFCNQYTNYSNDEITAKIENKVCATFLELIEEIELSNEPIEQIGKGEIEIRIKK